MSTSKKKKFKKFFIKILYVIIPAYLGWLGIEIVSLGKQVKENNANISKINDLEEKIDEITFNLNGDTSNQGILTRLNSIENKLDLPVIMVKDEDYLNIEASIEDNDIPTLKSSFEASTIIGADSDGNTYIAKDLINETILLAFVQDDKEIYFLGQYNDNYHWDGYCVTNTYNLDGSLFGICESNFDDGNRLDYESFYLSEIENEWIYADRDCAKDENGNAVNKGVSIRYKFIYGKIKNFTSTNIRISDILYIEDFEDSKNRTMLSYYSGATSDGLYNDETGKAYLVKYNENGYIETFYSGKFQDGHFHDENALEIVFDESNNLNRYFLYNGKFSNGNRESDENIRYITQKEICEIMEEHGFPSDLNWYDKN